MENLQILGKSDVKNFDKNVSVYVKRVYPKHVVRVMWAYDAHVDDIDDFVKDLVSEEERQWHKLQYGGYVCLVASWRGYVRLIGCDGSQPIPFYQVE